MDNRDDAIPMAFVSQNDNVRTVCQITYLRINMLMFLQKKESAMPMAYKLDLDW